MNSVFNKKAPVLFLVFNRPDTTEQVFERIKKYKPNKLFIAADGPRAGRVDDIKDCAAVRAIVNQIDWDCDVKTLLRQENLGCGRAISSAIDWFFQHVEYGIILEDDCVPEASFFDFCQLMLDRYMHDSRVMMIAGTSFLFNKKKRNESYFFAKYHPIWGWATWRRAWQKYDFMLQNWSREYEKKLLLDFFKNKEIVEFYARYFDRIVNHQIDTWDIQWSYACIKSQAFSIVPFNNLISNIGYVGTHSSGQKSDLHEISIKPINIERLVHPAEVIVDEYINKQLYYNTRVLRPLCVKAVLKKMIPFYPAIKRVLKRWLVL